MINLERAGDVRSLSKKLFNSQYRIEVAELVGSMGAEFTTQDLVDALQLAGDDLPWSCVTKELAVLVGLGLVARSGTRSADGRIPYARGQGFASFLAFLHEITPPPRGAVVEIRSSNITPIRRRGGNS
jgi:hypothetical protein